MQMDSANTSTDLGPRRRRPVAPRSVLFRLLHRYWAMQQSRYRARVDAMANRRTQLAPVRPDMTTNTRQDDTASSDAV